MLGDILLIGLFAAWVLYWLWLLTTVIHVKLVCRNKRGCIRDTCIHRRHCRHTARSPREQAEWDQLWTEIDKRT